MDEGPFRAPQPAERRVPSRETARQSAAVEKPEPVKEAPKPYRSERIPIPPIDESKKHSFFKRFFLPIITVIIILAIAFVGWTVFSQSQNSGTTGIDTSKYQAVFFTNGEVYFGKLSSVNDKYMKLTDIFYLHSDSSSSSTDSTTSGDTSSTDAQLIKLGNEAYGPEDEMTISRDQVSRYMNLKPDSKVVQLINKYTAK